MNKLFRFLRCVRAAKGLGDRGQFYVTSIVYAEMRKSVSYKVDISFDKNGVIHEAQCECSAGQGPSAHCKHVAAVLFGVTEFCHSGRFLTELTCTQVMLISNNNQTNNVVIFVGCLSDTHRKFCLQILFESSLIFVYSTIR